MMSAAPWRRLRRSCEARLNDLPFPTPFSAQALCELVAARRGRPILLLPMALSGDVCGMWVAADSMDLIFYEQATTSPHQQHIILHELSHLLCDHYPAGPTDPDQWRLLLPNLDPRMVHRVLGRTSYSEVEEQEAELLASLIQHRAFQLAAPEAATETNALTGRIRDLLDWSANDRPGPPD